jgi:hypothetical protein
MKKFFLPLLATALLAAPVQTALVTNVIDNFTTSQSVLTNNASATNTVTAPSAIGGYRTLILGSVGGSSSSGLASLEVFPDDGTLTLTSGNAAKASFQVTWGGLGGTNGLGGIRFGGGDPLDLSASFLTFSLRAADLPSAFTWSFTDISSVTATYVGSFPRSESPVPFDIALASFTNANSINWNAINLIAFSGGNVTALDLTVDAPIQVVASTVPEPGTFALLITGLGAAVVYVRRRRNRAR